VYAAGDCVVTHHLLGKTWLPLGTTAGSHRGAERARHRHLPRVRQALDRRLVRAADVVVTMGCGDACPVFPGKRYLDWTLDDPAGNTVDDVRPIRAEIDRRVRGLRGTLGGELAGSHRLPADGWERFSQRSLSVGNRTKGSLLV
jgi:hypothetical protein